MLRENKERQNSFYSVLYEKIPESHILKQIDKAVDFSFINDLLESSYCKNFGRPAKEPEMMMKLLFLQYIYNLSDVKVIEEANSIQILIHYFESGNNLRLVSGLFFMICVNTENGIKYRMVIGRVSRKTVYRP